MLKFRNIYFKHILIHCVTYKREFLEILTVTAVTKSYREKHVEILYIKNSAVDEFKTYFSNIYEKS